MSTEVSNKLGDKKNLLNDAMASWEKVVIQKLRPVSTISNSYVCPSWVPPLTNLNFNVDMMIFVGIEEMDGVDGELSKSDICAFDADGFPRVGYIKLDAKDVNIVVKQIFQHEIGHLLGLVNRHNRVAQYFGNNGKLFLGPNALAFWKSLGGDAAGIPVEYADVAQLTPGTFVVTGI